MKIMIIVDIQGNIYLELSNLEREMGERESSRKHIDRIDRNNYRIDRIIIE